MPRGVAVLAAVVALATAAALPAATADPLLGTWTVTGGGRGTIVVQGTSSVFKLLAGKTGVTLGCVSGSAGELVGFVALPRSTALPRGQYSATLGSPGQGCSYDTRLTLSGNRLAGTVRFSENDQPGGPFRFARSGSVKSSPFAWTVKVRRGGTTITGSGSGSATASGAVLAARGSLTISTGAYRWKATVDTPGTVKRGTSFRVVLAVNVTTGTCIGKQGTIVITRGHASVTGICSATNLAGSGTTSLR